MKYFTQPKNEPLLRKKRRPKEKAADFDLWMKEFTEQFIDVTFARGKEQNHLAASAHVKESNPECGSKELQQPAEVASSEIPSFDEDEDEFGFFARDMEAAAFEEVARQSAEKRRKLKWCTWAI